MPESDSPLDYIDYTSISFPSDRIAVSALRRAHPDLIDAEVTTNFFSTPTAQHGIGTILYAERLLARAAYEAALGKPGSILHERGLERADCLEDLTRLYSQYGVAQGAHHTEELVRAFEAHAAAQARSRGC